MYMKQVLRMLITLGFSIHFFVGCSGDNSPQSAIDEVTEAVTPNVSTMNSPAEAATTPVEPRFDTSLHEVQFQSQIVDARKEHETFKMAKEQEKETLLPSLEQKQHILSQADQEYEFLKQTHNELNERYMAVSQKYDSLNEIRNFNISDMEIFDDKNQFNQFFSGLQSHYETLKDNLTSRSDNKSIEAVVPHEDDLIMLAESGFQQMKDELNDLENQFFIPLNRFLKKIGINLYKKSEQRIAYLKEEIARIDAVQRDKPQIIVGEQESQTETDRAQNIEQLETLISNIEIATDEEKALNVYLINNPLQYSLDKLITYNAWKGEGDTFDFAFNVPRMFSIHSVEYLSGKHEIINKIAMAYEQRRQEQESIEEQQNELQAEIQELVETYKLNPTKNLAEAMNQISDYTKNSLEELSNKESAIAQQKAELETIQAQVESIDLAIQSSFEEFQQFEQQIHANPEYKKIALSQKIQESGLDSTFTDVINFIVEQHLFELSLSETEVNNATTALETIAEKSRGIDLEEFKMHYESIILEEFLDQDDILYNRQASNIFNPLKDGRIQELSGTLLFNIVKWKADQSLENTVIIFTERHILPGFLSQQEDGIYTLTGVETIAPGFALKHFGPTSEVTGDIRVFDAKWAITVHVLGEQIANLPEVVNDMQSQMEAYGFHKNNLLSIDADFLLKPTGNEEVKVERFFPFAFGSPAEKSGDLPRDSFEPVDVNQYMESKRLAVE